MAMAAPSPSSYPPPPSPTTSTLQTTIAPPKLPSNPTPLSAPQEQQVRDLYYKNVREKCSEEVKAFASCARTRTFTIPFACRAQKIAMNACMLRYQGQDEMDKARAEWFTLAGERRAKREETKRKTEEGRRKHAEWWGLDEEGKLMGRKAEDPALVKERERQGRA